MNILVGMFYNGKLQDAFIVDGYISKTSLINKLKRDFNNDNAVLDIFNYLDSDGDGTRLPYKLDLNPSTDFIDRGSETFECNDVNAFVNYANKLYNGALIWKDNRWWIYNTYDKTCRRVK